MVERTAQQKKPRPAAAAAPACKPGRVGRPREEGLAERRREEIIRHAIRHFARRGFANAELDAMAADIGCAKGTLYRYFESKCELFHSAVDFVMRGLLEAANASESADTVEMLEAAIRGFLAYFDANPDYVELLMLERAVFRDRKEPTFVKYRDQHRGRWRIRFAELMQAGRFRPMPVERVLDVLADVLYGTIFVNHLAHRAKSLEDQAGDVVDVLLGGLLTPAELKARESARTALGAGGRRRSAGGKAP